MHKTIDSREIQTAADLRTYIEEVEDLLKHTAADTIHLNVDRVSLVREKLTDGSHVFNLVFTTDR